MTAMAKAMARLHGRDYVLPEDVQEVFAATIAHRLILSPKAEARKLTVEKVLEDILKQVPAPRMY